MELYEAMAKRRTVREFLDKDVDFETVKRILSAGNMAPTNNHNRDWGYIILRTPEEKENILDKAKEIADRTQGNPSPRPLATPLAQKMYAHAMPRQYTMLHEAPYVIVPVFKCSGINADYISKLNPFATIWCVVENMFLAAAAEGLACCMRIPLNEEHDIVKAKLNVPSGYMIPVLIGIGYADPDETLPEQNVPELDEQLHFGSWE